MFTLDQVSIDELFVLMKGEPGTRKSTAALSFPTPQYWFCWDMKMESLLLPMLNWGINPKLISADNYTDWDKPRAQLEKLQLNCPYKTIVVDTITSAADSINRQTLKLKSGTSTKSGADAGKRIGSIPVNTIEDFNAEDSALKEMVSLLKDIHKFHKVNVILIGHIIQKEIKSQDGKTHMSRMLVTAGKGIAQKIPAYCTEVYHFNIKTGIDASVGGQYALKTTHTGDDFARTSLPLEPEIVFGNEPLYPKWIAPAIAKLKSQLSVINSSNTVQPTKPNIEVK